MYEAIGGLIAETCSMTHSSDQQARLPGNLPKKTVNVDTNSSLFCNNRCHDEFIFLCFRTLKYFRLHKLHYAARIPRAGRLCATRLWWRGKIFINKSSRGKFQNQKKLSSRRHSRCFNSSRGSAICSLLRRNARSVGCLTRHIGESNQLFLKVAVSFSSVFQLLC